MSYSTYQSLNNLETVQVAGGSEYEFEFDVFDELGSPINLAAYTITWLGKPYGKSQIYLNGNHMSPSSVTKSISVTNRVSIKFTASTTSGKWLHQIIVTNGGISYRPVQGIIIIVPQINTV